jgi:hypothetical protein
MILLLTFLVLNSLPEQFIPVSGFSELDNSATPTRFGLLLVSGEDSTLNYRMAALILAALDSLPDDADTDLYVVTPDCEGYPDIAALCGEYCGYPATLVLVGHCGYIELDPEYLSSEIIDSWYTWGSPDSRRTGICNFCRRCNP